MHRSSVAHACLFDATVWAPGIAVQSALCLALGNTGWATVFGLIAAGGLATAWAMATSAERADDAVLPGKRFVAHMDVSGFTTQVTLVQMMPCVLVAMGHPEMTLAANLWTFGLGPWRRRGGQTPVPLPNATLQIIGYNRISIGILTGEGPATTYAKGALGGTARELRRVTHGVLIEQPIGSSTKSAARTPAQAQARPT